ncbi:MAG: hypothetical protein J4F36_14685, partial [Nitrosopumilaceae archaeon]|nr:hypothetical protein [Nitrosopumilaceae archaeon]
MLSSDDNFCEKLVKEDIYYFEFMDGCKTQAMCDYAVEKDPWCLEFVPVDLMTQPMCEKAVEKDPRCIMFVRRMFKT